MKLQTDYDIALATNNIGIHLYAIKQEESGTCSKPLNLDTRQQKQQPFKNRSNIKRRLLR